MGGIFDALSGNEWVVKTIAPIVMLAVLVVVHEFGHFLFAKVFGVGVEKFSVGFGPRIFGVTYGGTEYRLAWIPLGGYVRMVGEDPFEELSGEPSPNSYLQKAAWKRLLIAFAGPLFNLLLPVALFSGLYLAGAPEPTTWVGMVMEDSAASRSGIAVGDRVVAIGDRETRYYSELRDALNKVPLNGQTSVTVEREGQRRTVDVTLKAEPSYNEWGEQIEQNVLGVSPTSARPLIGVDPVNVSPAYAAGLRSGDKVTKVNGEPVEWSYQLLEKLRDPALQQLALEVTRGDTELKVSLQRTDYQLPVTKDGQGVGQLGAETLAQVHPGAPWGIFPYEVFIKEAIPGRPAAKAGLRDGDMLYTVNGTPIVRWLDLKKAIEAPAEEIKEITLLRQGEFRVIPVQPDVVQVPTMTGGKKAEGQIGIRPPEVYQRDEAPLRLSVFEAVSRGVQETISITYAGGRILGRIVTGDIPLSESLGGPISIVTIAAQSAWVSVFQYVRVMALLSVNLALINLLPIPLLDGGHILFFAVEMLRGRPVSMRFREIAQQVGLLLLFALMAFAFANDVRMSVFR